MCPDRLSSARWAGGAVRGPTERRQHLDRSRLPTPYDYYPAQLGQLIGAGEWRSALCCFHEDKNPSLRVNLRSGSFRCFACDARGGDILDFQQMRYKQSFPEAARALGAWRERL